MCCLQCRLGLLPWCSLPVVDHRPPQVPSNLTLWFCVPLANLLIPADRFKWMASLRTSSDNEETGGTKGVHACAATLIHRQVLLTAAHWCERACLPARPPASDACNERSAAFCCTPLPTAPALASGLLAAFEAMITACSFHW